MPLVVEWSTLETVYHDFLHYTDRVPGRRVENTRCTHAIQGRFMGAILFTFNISVKFLCFLDDGHNRMMLIFQWYVCLDLQISQKVKQKIPLSGRNQFLYLEYVVCVSRFLSTTTY